MALHSRTGTDPAATCLPAVTLAGPVAALPSVVAVDAGGTSTRAAWLAADGSCLGLGRSGGGNPVARGVAVTARQIREALAAAAGPARRFPPDHGPAVAVIAMAGGGTMDQPTLATALADIGFDGTLLLSSDILAGYLSGAQEPAGYGLVAGTGAAAIRVVGGVETAVADGVGWLLGDRGSGFWIGLRAAQATTRALDRSGPLPALAQAVLAAYGVPTTANGGDVERRHDVVGPLVRALYGAAPVDLAALAPVAMRVAADGDGEAAEILRLAVSELVRTVGSIVDPDMPGPIVISGGVALALPGLAAALEDVQRAHGWSADIRTARDGLVGAGILALKAGGITLSEAIVDRLRGGLTQSGTAA